MLLNVLNVVTLVAKVHASPRNLVCKTIYPRERVGSGHESSSSYCFTKSALFVKKKLYMWFFLESDGSHCFSKSAVTGLTEAT